MTIDMRRLPLWRNLVKDLSNLDVELGIGQLRLVAFKVSGLPTQDNRFYKSVGVGSDTYKSVRML